MNFFCTAEWPSSCSLFGFRETHRERAAWVAAARWMRRLPKADLALRARAARALARERFFPLALLLLQDVEKRVFDGKPLPRGAWRGDETADATHPFRASRRVERRLLS